MRFGVSLARKGVKNLQALALDLSQAVDKVFLHHPREAVERLELRWQGGS